MINAIMCFLERVYHFVLERHQTAKVMLLIGSDGLASLEKDAKSVLVMVWKIRFVDLIWNMEIAVGCLHTTVHVILKNLQVSKRRKCVCVHCL